jgi:acyl-CoA synthetase (AMP-forming)/AMP-acid ligase II
MHSFPTRLEGFGPAEAIVFHGAATSYTDLVQEVRRWRQHLSAEGVTAGQVVALEAVYSPQACACLLALVDLSTVVVPLSGLPDAKRREFLEIAEAEAVVSLDAAGRLTGFARTGTTARHALYGQLRDRRTPGLVLFSSGTTGRSKASVLDFAKVLGRYGVPTRPRRTLSFLNLDHIGGINTIFHTFSQGGAVVTVAERAPEAVFAAIEAHRVEVLPTTPTFLNMVLVSGVHERYDTSSLRLLTYGTEPMPAQTLRRLRQVFPHVRLKQTYGLSELGILPTRSKDDDSLWVKLGDAGFEHKIVDGILWIRSDMAMLGYLNASAPFDAEGFFNTQDMVETDGEYVRILGRRSEVINVGGEKVYPSEVEGVLTDAPNVADATVSGRSSPVTGMVVMATVKLLEREDPAAAARRLRAHCAQRLEPFKVPALLEFSDADQHSERFKKIRSAA